MRVYFLSKKPAALKLGGIFLGLIDSFERFVDISLKDNILIEITPQDYNYATQSYIFNNEFIEKPPNNVSLYHIDGDYAIYFGKFERKLNKKFTLKQIQLNEKIATLYCNGQIQLSIDGDTAFELHLLDDDFFDGELSIIKIAEKNFLTVLTLDGDKKNIIIYNDVGKEVFKNVLTQIEYGRTLKTTQQLDDLARHTVKCEWEYVGENFKLISCDIKREITDFIIELLPYAFLQELLIDGTYQSYLADELNDKSEQLKEYLGNFIQVIPPPPNFCFKRKYENAVGLVYKLNENNYNVKFFECEFKENKILNIKPI